MKIVIDIKTENAAFQDEPAELHNILATLAKKIGFRDERDKTDKYGNLYDSNGNTVGKFKVTGK